MNDLDHILLIGRMGVGKSTWASQMAPEYLVIDRDGRWGDMTNARGKSHIITKSNAVQIKKEMDRVYPDLAGRIGTVIVDSVTSILDLELASGRLEVKSEGSKINANDVNLRKADTMRVLRGVLQTWHCSTLWVAHIEDGMMSGKAQTRVTIPKAELERLKIALNCILTMGIDKGRRYIKIEWCRYEDGNGKAPAVGQVLWDSDGMWRGGPQRLSTFIRNFTGQEGYNGNVYSVSWLKSFLSTKGVEFSSVDEMRAKLGIKDEPLWFDRIGWSVFIERAGISIK